jgi:DNA-binding NtrC family response regulator
MTVDDDEHLINLVEYELQDAGYAHTGVRSVKQMWAALEDITPNVILLDLQLGGQDGSALIAPLKETLPDVPVIVITGHATVDAAVKSLKVGAEDFICKPLDFARLKVEIEKAIKHSRMKVKIKVLESTERDNDFHGMVGRSEIMKKLYHRIEIVAPTDASVLILGETGAGKELVARAVHRCSQRAAGPFVPVNAPAIPHELIESALFGHEKGAFTGAHQRYMGFCEQADGGTLFLDEICEMDYNVQAKLLRFLQDHVVQPVGARSRKTVDVRVIAATNRDPQVHIANEKLRSDFYYRLSMVTIDLPPLRDRRDDILQLAGHFLDLARRKYGRNMTTITPQAKEILRSYNWPGNIRELEHLIHQVVITNTGQELTPRMLEGLQKGGTLIPAAAQGGENIPIEAIPSINEMEHSLIREALEATQGSIPAVAKQLGLSQTTLYRKIKKFGLQKTFVKDAQ